MNTPYQVTSTTYIDTAKEDSQESSEQKKQNPNELNSSEKQLVSELQARDTEVRAHEAAHQAAGGGMTGGASFTYEKGPDDRMYAVGGEVPIAIKDGSTPEEKIANARQVQTAAMAPTNPSGQDYAVAASAKVMEMKAQRELAKEQQEQMRGEKEYANSSDLNQDPEASKDYKHFDVSA